MGIKRLVLFFITVSVLLISLVGYKFIFNKDSTAPNDKEPVPFSIKEDSDQQIKKPAKKNSSKPNSSTAYNDQPEVFGAEESSMQSVNTSNSSTTKKAVKTIYVTQEFSLGKPLEEFPFPIMTDPPHRVHDPVTDFESVTVDDNGSYEFILPDATSDDGLYGRFWLSPKPPASNAKLAGIKFYNASWLGSPANTIVVFSLLDRNTEDNALGSVTGATQGLANQLVGVLFDTSSDVITLSFNNPVSNSKNRFVAVIDSENVPMGEPSTIFVNKINVSKIEWLWSY